MLQLRGFISKEIKRLYSNDFITNFINWGELLKFSPISYIHILKAIKYMNFARF